MKRYILLFSAAILISAFAKAQYVYIPDSSLMYWLQQNYPNCMNGSLLDTTCPEVLETTQLLPQVDSNITGLQYFKAAQSLQLQSVNGGNAFSTLTGNYPPNLTFLVISSSYMEYIPGNLPAGLQYLEVGGLGLFQLPPLPSGLHVLDISYNYISANSPVFTTGWPTMLDTLVVDNTDFQSVSFPALPQGLLYFSAEDCAFTSPPALPSLLQYLNISGWGITLGSDYFPFPPYLTYLVVDYDYFPGDTLPALPASLQILSAEYCLLNKAPVYPSGLLNLNLSGNSISIFAPFPAGLSYLTCDFNPDTTLPALPASLTELECGGTNFTTIPPLPAGLTYLACNQSPITSVPALPYLLPYLQLTDDGQLSSLPSPLPVALVELEVENDSSLTCFPPLPSTISTLLWQSTGITCLPNYLSASAYCIPAINTAPLCSVNSGCQPNWNISGSVYFNSSGGCLHQPGEPLLQPVKINLLQGGNLIQQMYAPGAYSFKTNFNSYTVEVDTTSAPFEFDCFSDSTLTISAADSLQVVNFEAHCKAGFDLGVNYITDLGEFFPGETTTVNISAGDVILNQYGVSCNTIGLSGQVQITFTGPVTYAGVADGVTTPTSVSGDTITWNIADFSQGNGRYDILLYTSTTANASDVVCVDVNITPTAGDNNLSNNNVEQCFNVHNSFDPNYKEVSPVSELPYPYSDWLTYTVHFQNTGTATAHNISVTDTLDTNVDPSSFQLLAYSYEPTVQITGRYVTFYFNQILLPDSAANPQGSTGYVQYRVKPLANLGIGTTISNTAYIYFDYNSPVVTNSTTNTVTATAGISALPTGTGPFVSIYPNPSVGNWQLAVGNELVGSALEVYDEQGRLVFQSQIQNLKSKIDLDVAAGVYYVRISNAAHSVVRKLVKIN